jgi:multisubunit Na+/H+ antiporter MnhB subunit
MKKIISYLFEYIRSLHLLIAIPSLLFIAFAIYANYHFDLNGQIETREPAIRFVSWMTVFLLAFSFAYILLKGVKPAHFRPDKKFISLVIIAAGLFALKMAFPVKLELGEEESRRQFLNALIYFPVKLTVMLIALFFAWKTFDRDQPFYGSSVKDFKPAPYLLMLLLMLPLVIIAAMQPDFQVLYPKFMKLSWFAEGKGTALEKLLYELSYGSDFLSIEFFFRGFLVLAFVKWAGKDAILPMALFYCTIHFGKPLGECISSFFGGILLGVITYHTKTIWGGLMVHLGIAWMMEAAGYLVT